MKAPTAHPFRSVECQAQYQALYASRARAWPVPNETRLLDTPSGRTCVRLSGRQSDPPLVLLHGARGNSLMWIPNIAALSARYRTSAVDTIGETGLSVSRRRIRRPDQLMAWLDEVLAELSPGAPANLCGMSYGGWLAVEYALRYPARVRKVVLLAPAATVQPVSRAMLVRAALTLLPGIAFRRRFYYWLLHDAVLSGPEGRARVDEYVEDWAMAERCFRQLLLVPAGVLSDQALGSLSVPALYLVGENEKVYPARKAVQRLQRVAPQIQAKLIAGAGHDLWMVQPEAVTTAVLSFLDEADSKSGQMAQPGAPQPLGTAPRSAATGRRARWPPIARGW
jgi:pimeloyl-ACP methyl ester carboxylesterase